MKAQQLKNSILQLAIQGKLVPQNDSDEPASELIKRIRKEKEQLIKEGKIKKDKNPSYIFRGSDNLPYEKVGNNAPVCIAEEVPFEIPEFWELARLKNLCFLNDGTKKEKCSNIIMDAKFLRGKKDGDYSDFGRFVTKGSYLILVDGENSGEVFIAPIDGYLGSTFKNLVLSNEVLTEYVLKFIAFNKAKLKNSKKGAAIPHLDKNLFFNLILPVPPLAEQQRIVEKIEQLLPYIEEYDKVEQKNTQLDLSFPDLLKKSILQEAIQGKLVPQDPNDEPASELIKRIRAEKEQLIKEKKIKKDRNESFIFRRDNSHYENINGIEHCIDDEIPFDIPDSWAWVRLQECAILQTGTTPSTADTSNFGSDIPFIKPADIKTNNIDYNNEGLSFKGLSKGRLIPKNAVIMVCIGGSTGKCFYTDKDISCNQQINTANPLLINTKFLFFVLSSPYFQDIVHLKSGGTATPIINKAEWGNIIIPIPSLHEQQRIVEKIEQLLPNIDKLEM